jgi:hypothetical protein
MIILGILAVCQLTFLPGSLALRLWFGFNKKRGDSPTGVGWIPALAYSFGLSLILNYCLVFLLTVLHAYTRPVVGVLMGLEWIAWGWAFRDFLLGSLGQSAGKLGARARQWLASLLSADGETGPDGSLARLLSGVTTVAFLGLALWSLLWIGTVCITNLGSVFNSWDAVMSWNRWAIEWSQNRLPSETAYYPQLIPTNWSLAYVFTGNNQVQFFAKAIMPLFLSFTLLVVFDLGLDYRKSGFFLAVTLAQLMFKKYTGEFIAEGYVDIPVAFMGLLAVYPLLKKYERFPLMPVLLGAIFAAGAAVTKQAGIFLLLVYPLLAFLILRGETLDFDLRRNWKKIGLVLTLAVLIALPWYVYKQIAIQIGIDTSNVELLVDTIYGGLGLMDRFIQALKSLEKYFWLVVLLLPALFWLPRRIRWTTILVVFPYTLIWGFLFSYSTRNFALAVPFVALGAGVAIGQFLDWLYGLAARVGLSRAPGLVLVAIVLAGLGALSVFIPEQVLADRQVELQKQVFSPQLNQKLYDYLRNHAGQNARILTNYPIAYLPGLEENQVNFWYEDFAEYNELRDGKKFDYLLVPFYANQDINADIDQRLQSGEYELIFEDNHYLTYRFIQVK